MANTVYTQTVELNENNNIYPAINTFTILSQERNFQRHMLWSILI